MTQADLMTLLENRVAELGQAEVARRLGISSSAVSQLRHGKYSAAPDAILQRVREVFGAETVVCPVLGDIPLGQCADIRKRPFTIGNRQQVTLWKTCQTCERK